jgi:hypothetical protein
MQEWRALVAVSTIAPSEKFHVAAGDKRMACPFFMPVEKLENGAWPHPARLPLGAGWSGRCTAPGHEGEIPAQHGLEQFCNLGYAAGCERLPPDRAWDAVRFAVTGGAQAKSAQGGPSNDGKSNDHDGTLRLSNRIVQLRYVCERDHQPVEDGKLEFDAGRAQWLQRHSDGRVQKMAECFMESHLAKRKLQAEGAAK